MVETVDLRRLQVLRMVRDTGTVTAAATALHLTPSAVSHQLRQLAREIDLELLERDGRGVRLTPAGVRLVAHADALHAQWEGVQADLAAEQDGRVGVLRMAGFPSAISAVLVPTARKLSAAEPGVDVQITEIDRSTEGYDLVLANETDIALVAPNLDGPSLDDGRFEQCTLLVEPLDLVLPISHPLSTHEVVELGDAAREPWILAGPAGWDCHQLVAAACTAAGFSPRIVHDARSPVAVGALVAAGLGITLVPRQLPLDPGDAVVRRPLVGDPPPSRAIVTCVRRGSAVRPLIARGLEALAAVATDLPRPLPAATGSTPVSAQPA